MRTAPLLVFAATLLPGSLLGCRSSDKDEGEIGYEALTDADGDGFYAEQDDCDDDEAAAYPGAEEVCDGIDNDCDGDADEGLLSDWYRDADADGHGDAASVENACEQPQGYVALDDDCDDLDADVYPEAPERCDDLDNDCDGEVDEDITELWYADSDGDGYGDAASTLESCDPDAGWVADSTDCDDDAAETFPGAEEICDEADNDCDDEIDEGVLLTFYSDADGDGWGDEASPVEACEEPSGATERAGDCDDTDASVSPVATELCDEVDNDCDGTVDEDEAADAATFYADGDSDGYGDADSTAEACEAPSGYVDDDEDCDDSDASISPAAAEVCDEVDNDCDGLVDDEDPSLSGASTWYIDYDSDGYGASTYSTEACEQPTGYVDNTDDCDDTTDAASPAEAEVCDEIDNDCDGDIDEDDASDALTWYADLDGDSYGNASSSTTACEEPSGYVGDDTDCDDTDDTVYPDAAELYDGLDNDCDGDIDEDLWLGTGADGSLTVSGTTDLSTDASGSRTVADAVSYGVTAISSTDLTVDDTVSGIAAGDEVLIINLQGSDSYDGAVGTYEFAWVDSVSGSTITLADAVAGTYGDSSNSDLTDQVVIVQRVPQYEDVTVDATGTLTTSAWDGSAGGVLAFRATGTVSVASGGAITVAELGYTGGDTGTCNNCDAFQGESYLGEGDGDEYGGPYNEAIGAYAANEGGGGANVTGGGGNHAGGATDGDSWNGGSYTAPSAGDTYGDDELTGLFFGSGGGGVWNGGTDTTGEDPGPGGDGGGILYIGAALIQTDDADAIVAYGGDTDHWAAGSWTYGAGGGAGGSVFLVADEVDLASGSVDAQGGLGQSSYIRAGGDGGYGRVRIDCNTCNGAASGSTSAESALQDAAEPDPGYSTTPS